MPAIGTAIAGVLTAFKATAIGTFLTSTFTGKLLASVALSALQVALAPRPATPGIVTEFTSTGGTNPRAFILGRYATAGQEVCPPMTHGAAGKTPNAYLTYVIALGDIAGQTLEKVYIDGTEVVLGGVVDANYGTTPTGRYANFAWFKYYDGTQTVADPGLLAKYGAYPERPWLADMKGTGVCYLICTFRFNQNLYGGLPSVLVQCGGIKLYDPRKDTTVGGSGAHRWATPSTWEQTTNSAVLNYNIARGITLSSLGTWGGDFAEAELPLASWFVAMNRCDVQVGSPLESEFRAGFEVKVDMEPAAVMEEVLKGCTGQMAEVGGALKMRVGGPGGPVLFITDDDIIVTKPQDYQPFANAQGRQNGIEAKYPDPADFWQAKSAPPLYNTTWETEDAGRRMTSLDLPACPYPFQVRRVMKSYITDARRMRSHGITLPPDAAVLEPMDVITWTSARNNYTSKQFEVADIADDPLTGLQRVSLREVDPTDYVAPTGLVAASNASSASVDPAAQTLPGWTVSGFVVADSASAARSPAIIAIWNGADLDDATGVQYQCRVSGTGLVVEEGVISNVLDGKVIVSGPILRNTTYEMRGKLLVQGRASNWTSWTSALSPNIASVQAGDVGANVINAGNLVGQSTSGKSLNIDPHFLDVSAWSFADAPTFVTLTDGASGNRAVRAGDGTHVFSLPFPVNVSKQYRVRSWYRRSATADGYLFIRLYFYDALDAQISYDENNVLVPASSGTAWAELVKSEIVPPAGAVTARIAVILNYAGTLGYHEAQGLSCEEMTNRDTITDGAVSDKFQAILLGPLTSIGDGNNIELLRLSVGQRLAGKILKWAWAVEARNPDILSYSIAAQQRTKYNGVWGAWISIGTAVVPPGSTGWFARDSALTVGGNYDDREYRICTDNDPATRALTGGDFIKNIYLTAVELVR
jgi:hypothetical protein